MGAIQSTSRLDVRNKQKETGPVWAPSLFEVVWLMTSGNLGALAGGAAHRARDLREDLADVVGDARHDSARGDSDEAGHQSVFDKVLAFGVLKDRKRIEDVLDTVHIILSLSMQPPSVGC